MLGLAFVEWRFQPWSWHLDIQLFLPWRLSEHPEHMPCWVNVLACDVLCRATVILGSAVAEHGRTTSLILA